ncbi:MAG: carboxypeptidase regulatory-like domain-containing protein [Vicinamibacterales bacterium]
MTKSFALGILAICAAPVAAGAQAAGSLSGVVTTSARALAPIRVTIDQKVCGNEMPDEAVAVDAQGHLANVVITLTGVKATGAPADTPVINEKCRFAPRVQVARPNTKVRTTSKDPMLHTTNAATAAGKTLFNVALPFPGMDIVKPIGGAGLLRLTCNIHPWMRGFIVVTDEMAAVTGADGRFSLAGVPPGTYELKVWHEVLKAAAQKITVVSGKPTNVLLQMK